MQTEFLGSILDINADEWDSLWASEYPFIKHGFLALLEKSGCTTSETGWTPCHLLLRGEEQKIMAAMPLYQKHHSYGEYVFDWGWADAYHRSGLEYYPKLLNAIPFTPATGPRVTFAKGLSEVKKQQCTKLLFNAVKEKTSQSAGSGFHSLFPNADNRRLFSAEQFVQRQGCQFHWFNQGYRHFDDFLASFSSRKRKNIKKEREKIRAQNIQLQMRKAGDLSTEDWQRFYWLYQRTYFKRSGHQGYLSKAFFMAIASTLPDNILLCTAHENSLDSEILAAALYFYDSTTLYGRYWGAMAELDGLHFEACYYQGIEYAIANGLQRFDPGAQGEHKIQRGFTPVKTCSYHRLAQPQFHQAVAQFAREERQHNNAYCLDGRTYLPFKEGVECVDENVLFDTSPSQSVL
ncbi:hypothetical protein SAMN02745866_01592 [Alteromonadaceae bacterium Bs31]|nr:hypothetical protein SAMN02745866_01592 [Alteromonadaceae bacterium Bs31]